MMKPRYRVGRRCPWNVYRINPDSEDRDDDDRFAVAIGPDAPADGPLVAAALNAYPLLAKFGNAVALPVDWQEQVRSLGNLVRGGWKYESALVELINSWRPAAQEAQPGDSATPGPHHPAGSPEAHFRPAPQRDQLRDQSTAGAAQEAPPEHSEPQWQITIRVPMRLPVEARHELFGAVTSAVSDWEPPCRSGWDADVFGHPAATQEAGEPPPRVWQTVDPEPDGVRQVRDRFGLVWERKNSGDWGWPLGPCTQAWVALSHHSGPLTEEIPGVPSGGDPEPLPYSGQHAEDCQGCEQIPGVVHCSAEEIEGGDSHGYAGR